MIVYVAGKYSNNGKANGERSKNIEKAKNVAIQLWNMGYGVFCPHTNTAYFDDDKNLTIDWKQFLEKDKEIISRCDAVYLLDNWQESAGAKIEEKFARTNNIPILQTMQEAALFIKRKQIVCTCCGLVRKHMTIYNTNISICSTCRNTLKDIKPIYWNMFTKDYIPIPRME